MPVMVGGKKVTRAEMLKTAHETVKPVVGPLTAAMMMYEAAAVDEGMKVMTAAWVPVLTKAEMKTVARVMTA